MSKKNIIDHLEAAFAGMIKKAAKGTAADELKEFLSSFYGLSTPDDLLMREPKELFDIGVNLWRASAMRKPGEASVFVAGPLGTAAADENTTPHTAIMIVNDDMPFLVDSITGCLSSSMHYRIHMMHHPILDVPRDSKGARIQNNGTERVRESYMYVEVGAQSDPVALELFSFFVG